MHYLNASEDSYVDSLIRIQIPDFISQESTYLRVYMCVCENLRPYSVLSPLLLISCVVFTRMLLRETNQTLLQKNLFLPECSECLCQWLWSEIGVQREGPHEMLSSVSSINVFLCTLKKQISGSDDSRMFLYNQQYLVPFHTINTSWFLTPSVFVCVRMCVCVCACLHLMLQCIDSFSTNVCN